MPNDRIKDLGLSIPILLDQTWSVRPTLQLLQSAPAPPVLTPALSRSTWKKASPTSLDTASVLESTNNFVSPRNPTILMIANRSPNRGPSGYSKTPSTHSKAIWCLLHCLRSNFVCLWTAHNNSVMKLLCLAVADKICFSSFLLISNGIDLIGIAGS